MRNLFLEALIQIILKLATTEFIAESIVLFGRKLSALTKTDIDDQFVELVAKALKVTPREIVRSLQKSAVI